MEAALAHIPANVVVLFAALILERLLPLPPKYNPLNFFSALTLAISAKVHPKDRAQTMGQQKLSGALALPTLLLPFLFVAYMMTLVAEFPYLFDTILLWLCLSWTALKKDLLAMLRALKREQKSLAKARLSGWVLRRTDNLSTLGLCKAATETLILRSSKSYFALIFYYLCFGSLFMLTYRLIGLLNQCWNPKIPHYRHFGQLTQRICYWLDWVPSRFVALTLMLLTNFSHSFKLIKNARGWGNGNSLNLLGAVAGGLKVSLGGPVYYSNDKLRRTVITSRVCREPDPASVRQTITLIEKVLVIWLLLIVLFTAMHLAMM